MAMAAGAVMRIAGGITGGIAADQRRKRYEDFMAGLREPNPTQEAGNWFSDLNQFYNQANTLSQRARSDELTQDLALRERAIPGSTAAINAGMANVSDLLAGRVPQSVMNNFIRAGGASTVGGGWGGSGFGALNTGLFGARGSLGAIQTGMGLLPTMLSTMPNLQAPTTMGLLGQLLTPEQRVNMQMQIRQQKIGMENQLESLPTALDAWSQHLNESGAMLMGAGTMGMGGGGNPRFGSNVDPESGVSKFGNWGSFSGIGSVQPSGGNMGTGE